MANFGKCLGFFDRQGFDATTNTFANWVNNAYNGVLGGVVIRGNPLGSSGVDGMTWAQLQPNAGTPAGSGALVSAGGTAYIDAMFNQADAYNANTTGSGGGGSGLPNPDHIVVVWYENVPYWTINGSSSAPYINNTLKPNSAWFTKSVGVTHPSEPNYIAFWSGSQQGVANDYRCNQTCTGTCTGTSGPTPGAPFSAASLGSQMAAKSLSYAGYFESMPSNGYIACNSGNYATKHNPLADFTSDAGATTNLAFSTWSLGGAATWHPNTSDYSDLPRLSFVVPNLQNDMHSGPIPTGDAWLKANIEPYRQWAMTHNSLLIFSFDEGDGTPPSGFLPNQIVTAFAGQVVVNGTYPEASAKDGLGHTGQISHYNILRTIQAILNLGTLGNSATATPIIDCWQPGPPPPPTVNPWTLKLRIFGGENAPAWARAGGPGNAPNLLQQPFASTSIWNTAIGSGAVFSASPVLTQPTVLMRADQSPILMDTTQTNLATIVNNTCGFNPVTNCGAGATRCTSTKPLLSPVSVPVNPNFTISPSVFKNNESGLIDPTGTIVYEATAYATCSTTEITTTAQDSYHESLSGAGLGPSGAVPGGHGGKGGSGLSTLGGVIRKGELLGPDIHSIKHALAINIDLFDLASNTSDGMGGTAGNGWMWPAIKKDGYNYNGSSGFIAEGSLLALPQSFNPATQCTTIPGQKIAQALRDYGGYVGNDTKGSAFAICTEISPDGMNGTPIYVSAGTATSVDVDEWNANYSALGTFNTGSQTGSAWENDLAAIITNLYAITNQNANNIGGGGTPLISQVGTTTPWWSATYEAAWERFMQTLGNYVPQYNIRTSSSSGGLGGSGPFPIANTHKLDGHPLLGAVNEFACMTAIDEPLKKTDFNSGLGLSEALSAGMTDNAEFNSGNMTGTQISAMSSMKTTMPKTVWAVIYNPMETIQAGGTSEAKTELLVDYQVGGQLSPQVSPNSGSLGLQAEMSNDTLRANNTAVDTPFQQGISTATGANTLTDSTNAPAWTTNIYAGGKVYSGGSSMTIASNTGTSVTGTGNWSPSQPASGLAYTIFLDPGGTDYSSLYTKMATYSMGPANTGLQRPLPVNPQPISFQTASLTAMTTSPTSSHDSLLNTIQYGIWLGARMLELPPGYSVLTTAELQPFIAQLIANDPPLHAIVNAPPAVSALTSGFWPARPRISASRLKVAPPSAPPVLPHGIDSTWPLKRGRG